MPPDSLPQELPFKWRQATAVAISKTAFGKLALEHGPKFRVTQIGSTAYGALETDDGFDFYYTADAWLYQARRVNTQTNAGGGALATRVSMNAGQVGELVQVRMEGTASATATLTSYLFDEDGAYMGSLAYVAAGASLKAHLPSVGTAASASANLIQTIGMKWGPGQALSVASSVALQNEQLTVGVVLLLSTPDIPIFDTTGSAGTPSLAASTISVANTLQAVLMP